MDSLKICDDFSGLNMSAEVIFTENSGGCKGQTILASWKWCLPLELKSPSGTNCFSINSSEMYFVGKDLTLGAGEGEESGCIKLDRGELKVALSKNPTLPVFSLVSF